MIVVSRMPHLKTLSCSDCSVKCSLCAELLGHYNGADNMLGNKARNAQHYMPIKCYMSLFGQAISNKILHLSTWN